MIAFRGVHKAFGKHTVLAGLDLEVGDGELMFLVGTSGVGKSVAIKQVVGLLRPDAGRIELGGERVDHLDERALYAVRRRCAMVLQHSTLFDSMTLLDNVALPLRWHRGHDDQAARAEARTLLAQVGLAELTDALPAELGDGVKKRAAIARALSLEPEYVLFDEPTTGLDPVSARRIDRLIRDLKEQRGVTAIVVSHDLKSIFSIADRVAMLYRGVVHVVGTPAELRASSDPIVRQFISGLADGPLETPGF